MVRREADGGGVGRQVVEPQRARVDDEPAEDALPARQVPDLLPERVVHSDVHEPSERAAVGREHAERAVAGVDEVDRGLHHTPVGGRGGDAGWGGTGRGVRRPDAPGPSRRDDRL